MWNESEIIGKNSSQPQSVRAKKSSAVAVPDHEGVKYLESFIVLKPREKVFEAFTSLERLLDFLPHTQDIKKIGTGRIQWTLKGGGERPIHWTTQIIEKHFPAMLSWKTVDPSDLASAGSIWFRELPEKSATELRFMAKFDFPNEYLKTTFQKVFGLSPSQLLHGRLRRFKCFIETGVVSTTEGQSHGGSVITAKKVL